MPTRFSTCSYRVASSSWQRIVARRACATSSLTALLVLLLLSPASAQWQIVPELRVNGGDESDLVIDPLVTGAVVPGGPFAEIAPAVSARRWLGGGALVSLGTHATLQQFLNDESRVLYAQTVSGDALWSLDALLRGRLSASLDFFNDSERESVRRTGISGEVGIAAVMKEWSAEVWVGGRGRRYPNIDVTDSQGRPSTYGEASWSGGTTLRGFTKGRVAVRADGIVETTDSRDPQFDSRSWQVSANADVRLTSRLFTTVFGTFQERKFTERLAGDDRDEYIQYGLGARYALAAGWEASLRWGYSRYTWPNGTDQDSHRLAAGIRYAWGRPAPPLPRLDLDALLGDGGAVRQRDSQGNVGFRIHAPDAAAVGVAGSFNGWDARKTPLIRVAGGWWEARINVAPGTYEYAYVIDGTWKTPPEAVFTADDGFGGVNGILEVLPSDV